MSVIPLEEALRRSRRMLRSALGPEVCGWLDDDGVAEVMLNPDGRLWLDRLDGGLVATGVRMGACDAERTIRLVAHCAGAEVHIGRPRISAELPGGGERFEGLLPPVSAAPVFAIRKPARRLWFLTFSVEAPQNFDAVVADADGRVREIQVKAHAPASRWIWGAFKMPGAVFHELHALWRARRCEDEYLGTLVNAWIAAGGEAWSAPLGTGYVDVGTLNGYREALSLLAGVPATGSASSVRPSALP
jgi:hypothetical protein